MQIHGGALVLSASDLAGHLACARLTFLEHGAALGERKRPVRHDPALERLKERGQAHERAYVEHLRARGLEVRALGGLPRDEAERLTAEAVRAGVPVIVQAALRQGRWAGFADVLVRTEEPSGALAWSYEVQDTKLAHDTRAGTILQLCLYAEALAELQGTPARTFAVVKPGEGFPTERFRFAEFEAYHRSVKARLEAFLAREGAEPYPEPVEHCEVCRWWAGCDERRRADDHLSLVAGMRRAAADELRRQGRATLAELARAPSALVEAPLHGRREAFEGLHGQARVQLRGRESGRPEHELLAPLEGRGFARLPEPDAGDVYLDFEGDPFVPGAAGGTDGLEYLLGYVFRAADGHLCYEALWALTRAEERAAFERFLDFLGTRRTTFPRFHVYHYAPYEPAALKRLASRHATREAELDVLLREERFVDLYAVVRQGLRASVESYSLKALERFFGFERRVDLRLEARPALERVAAVLESGAAAELDPADRDAVQGYNEDDCRALPALQEWLEARRAELTPPPARPPLGDGSASESAEERREEVAELHRRLTEGLEPDPARRDDVARARALLANLLEYFRREERVAWWEFFARRAMDDEELLRERKALVGLEFVSERPPEGRKRSHVQLYRFPPQEVDLDPGDSVRDLRLELGAPGEKLGSIVSLDLATRTLELARAKQEKDLHPTALHAGDHVSQKVLEQALHAVARRIADEGMDSGGSELRAARDLLLARGPRLAGGARLEESGDFLTRARHAVHALDGGVLAIQGPPGTGKTHNGARLIVELARAGRRVGVTAVSHRVIRNLLEKVLEAAAEAQVTLGVAAKVSSTEPVPTDLPAGFEALEKNDAALAALDQGRVVGGVAWLWATDAAEGALDTLFVDEAGQMSLAQVLACARAARNLVLLGDPQQLQQPQRGAHPEGAEVSALAHLLGGEATVRAGRGLFLAETWRLAPGLCRFTSELFYESRLRARAGCERQRVGGPTRFAGEGLVLVPCAHAGNSSSAPQEVAGLERILAELLRAGTTWTDARGRTRPLTRDDVLVIAPYNAQVAALRRAPGLQGVAIGTVDLFQGQERPVVLYSLTSSTPADAPRGLPFLYDLHRLNVATSRAQGLCLVIGSPALFEPVCRSPEEMRLANGLCRLREAARLIEF